MIFPNNDFRAPAAMRAMNPETPRLLCRALGVLERSRQPHVPDPTNLKRRQVASTRWWVRSGSKFEGSRYVDTVADA
eukprot:3287767-Prymnesium_polylepis.1